LIPFRYGGPKILVSLVHRPPFNRPCSGPLPATSSPTRLLYSPPPAGAAFLASLQQSTANFHFTFFQAPSCFRYPVSPARRSSPLLGFPQRRSCAAVYYEPGVPHRNQTACSWTLWSLFFFSRVSRRPLGILHDPGFSVIRTFFFTPLSNPPPIHVSVLGPSVDVVIFPSIPQSLRNLFTALFPSCLKPPSQNPSTP